MYTNSFCILVIFISVLLIDFPVVVASSLSGKLTLAGSSTVQPVTEILAQEFETLHPAVQVDVQGGGSAVGITAPQSGLAEIGMVSRTLHLEEAQRLVATTFAHDGITLITHVTNPVSGLNRQQVINIYTGAVTCWRVFGGPDTRIVVINKEEGRGTLELFERYFDLQGKFVRDAIIIGPNGQAIAAVAGNPQAIAYVSIGSATVAVAQDTPIKLLTLDGVAATRDTVQNGTYGLLRPLNFVTVGPPRGLAKAFLDFVLTPAGQHIVKNQDFVPVHSLTAQQ